MTEPVAKGEGRVSETRTHAHRGFGDTESGPQCFLLTVKITACVPGPLGRGAPETPSGPLRETKNRAKSSWPVTQEVVETRLGLGRPAVSDAFVSSQREPRAAWGPLPSTWATGLRPVPSPARPLALDGGAWPSPEAGVGVTTVLTVHDIATEPKPQSRGRGCHGAQVRVCVCVSVCQSWPWPWPVCTTLSKVRWVRVWSSVS